MSWNNQNTNISWNSYNQQAPQNAQSSSDDVEMGWGDTITKDPEEYILIPPGTYRFTVSKFDRARFDGSEKMKAGPMAKIQLRVSVPPDLSEKGYVVVNYNLILNRKLEYKISEFFTAIGLKKKGEPLVMNWDKIIGQSGNVKIGNVKSRSGNMMNNVDGFVLPTEKIPGGLSPYDQGMPF